LFRLATDAAERAISLDPKEPGGWGALGFVRHVWAWDWKGSERAYIRARDLSPNYSESGLASLYGQALGRYDEAIAAYRRARLRRPRSLLLRYQFGAMLACAGRYDEAFQLLDPADLESSGSQLRFWKGRALLLAGRYSEAVSDLERYLQAGEDPPAWMAYAYAKARDTTKAREVVRIREERGIRSTADDVALSDDKALVRRLESMYANRDEHLARMRCYPEYKDVLKVPGAKAVLDRLKMPS
jgi:tetratricopeptide (TPR) repeat protein